MTSSRFGTAPQHLARLALPALFVCCPLAAIASGQSIRIVHALPSRTPAIRLDLRPPAPSSTEVCISAEEVEIGDATASADAKRWFELEPAGHKLVVGNATKWVYFEVLASAPEDSIELTVWPAFAATLEPVLKARCRKREGITRAILRCDVKASHGTRLSAGYYVITANCGARGAYGLVRIEPER
jgi:hypothetical protein